MRNILLVCLVLAGMVSASYAQPSEAMGKEKMKIFEAWSGKWKGEGSMQMGPGEPKKSTVEETIEYKLDGMILLVEGLGTSPNEAGENKVVHHAMAILSFNQQTQQYQFNTFLKDGRSSQAWFKALGNNQYQWGFDTPRGKTKYTITIDTTANTWQEIGEFATDGNTWMKFFEMNLKKQG
jgi:hypothetical protein